MIVTPATQATSIPVSLKNKIPFLDLDRKMLYFYPALPYLNKKGSFFTSEATPLPPPTDPPLILIH